MNSWIHNREFSPMAEPKEFEVPVMLEPAPAPSTTTWQDLLHKYGPWLLAVLVSVAMHYLDPTKPVVVPPVPTAEVHLAQPGNYTLTIPEAKK